MNSTRLDYLLNCYLDGELSPDEKHELQNTLLSDPEGSLASCMVFDPFVKR